MSSDERGSEKQVGAEVYNNPGDGMAASHSYRSRTRVVAGTYKETTKALRGCLCAEASKSYSFTL